MAILNVAKAMGLWLLITMTASIYLMPSKNITATSLSILFFNYLNLLISLCEQILGRHITLIKADYLELKEKYKGKEFAACIAFLTMPLNASEVFDGRLWSKMWSTYSLYDPSYQNHESFGFFIDVGNGWTTIIPTSIVNCAIIFPRELSTLSVDPSLLVGCSGLCTYWQMMYGALIYYLSYFFNKRYQGKSNIEIAGFVGFSNSLWVIFPMVGISACVQILADKNFDVFSI